MLLLLLLLLTPVLHARRAAVKKRKKFNQPPDQTTVKSTTPVGPSELLISGPMRFKSPRDEPLELIAIAGLSRRASGSRQTNDERTPSSECACNYRQTNERQIEVGSGCCCCGFSVHQQPTTRPTLPSAQQLNAAQA